MGYHVASYFVPDEFERTAMWDNYVEPGHEVGLYSSDVPDRLVALFLWQDANDTVVPPDRRRDVLMTAFADVGWQTERILAAAPANGEVFMDTVTQIRMDTWRTGRVVLVGDAAGCMTLISGQGASMALASGYVLAEELATTDGWKQALANYEHRTKPQIDLRQHKAKSFAKQFVPGSRVGVRAQTALMKVITHEAFSALLKKQFAGDSFLRTAAVHRLPDTHDAVLGVEISGHLHQTDYETLSMTLDDALAEYDTINLLVSLNGLAGIEPRALWSDWQFGRHYHDAIGRLAIVGDRRISALVSHLSQPWYAEKARHFATADIDEAWDWLERA